MHPYNTATKPLAQNLRNNSTQAEKLLWSRLLGMVWYDLMGF